MTTPSESITVSRLYFTALLAAEAELPAESMALIKGFDEAQRAWGKAGWTSPAPEAWTNAQAAVEADPLAAAVMHLRKLGNNALAKEYAS